MKTLIMILASSMIASAAQAGPYYRFWRGWKKPELSHPAFQEILSKTFVPETVKVGAGNGLLAYLPALPQPHNSIVPDEIALVVYESKARYDALRATPAGQNYANMHWDVFSREKGSKSLEPVAYTGPLQNLQAVDVLQSSAPWQKGFAVWTISKLNGSPDDYLRMVAQRFASKGLASYVVLSADSYLYEYQLWTSPAAYASARGLLFHLAQGVLGFVAGSAARPAALPNAYLRYGEALNLQF